MHTKFHDETFVFKVKPRDFVPNIQIAACYIEFNKKILFLKRAIGKHEGGKWGVPAGKIERDESSRESVIRETYEETKIVLSEKKLKFVGKLFVCKPEIKYVYHMYHLRSNHLLDINLNNEHQDYRWLSIDEIANFPIMSGGLEAFNHFKSFLKYN